MSYLPQLNQTSKTQMIQQEFRGYNHNEYTQDSELYDDCNMTCSNYPYISPRPVRGEFRDAQGSPFGKYTFENGGTAVCNGISSIHGFCFAEGNRFYYKSPADNMYHDIGAVEDSEKQFVPLGAYILIFPDKKYFWSTMYLHYDDEEWLKEHNLEKSAYFGDLGADMQFGGTGVRMNMCNVYGEDYEFDYIQEDIPDSEDEKLKNGAMWLDISSSPAKMMQYSDSYSGWLEITSNYIKVTVSGDVTAQFREWDGVTLSGFPEALGDFNSSTVIYTAGKNSDGTSYFVIPGIIKPQTAIESNIVYDSSESNKTNSIYYYYSLYKETYSQTDSEGREKISCDYYTDSQKLKKVYSYTYEDPEFGEPVTGSASKLMIVKSKVNMERKIPDMDFVAELDNRLWGCSSDNHEIYASKPGDPFNFNYFLGGASDSYVLTVGSDGDFTGCIAHLGYMLFFKENTVHKLYGTKASNFQLTSLAVRGVEKGSHKSLCIVNETLFYKSADGIMMYQGSLPECISDELGTEKYHSAAAASLGGKYYVSMQNTAGVWQLFTYDTVFGLWHKEDETQFKFAASVPGNIYYIDGNDEMKSVLALSGGFTVKRLVSSDISEASEYAETEYFVRSEPPFGWYFETGDLYSGSIDSKYISRLRMLFTISQDTSLDIFIKYDNGEFRWVCRKDFRYTGTRRDTRSIPIPVRRARRMRVRIEGTGACMIQALAMNVEQGSEL